MKRNVILGLAIVLSSCLGEDVPSITSQLNKEVKAIDAYLVANPPDPTDIIVKDASGVRLVITQPGTGTIPPNYGNNLKVAYTGRRFSDGAIFDSNNEFYMKLSDNVIGGWKIALALLTEGAQAKVYIPSGWAYGPSGRDGLGGNPGIPGNETLVFDINLIDVVPTTEQNNKMIDDIELIDAHLLINEIDAEIHESGMRYVITQLGAGFTPSLYQQVRVRVKGKLITDGTVFIDRVIEPAPNFSCRVANFSPPHGILLGLQLLSEGGKVTVYVPSTLAYGGVTNTGVPANSNVIFELELLEVIN
jgi:FKBP-type peptidyl-prolyl cis-trans isomerase